MQSGSPSHNRLGERVTANERTVTVTTNERRWYREERGYTYTSIIYYTAQQYLGVKKAVLAPQSPHSASSLPSPQSSRPSQYLQGKK